MSSGLTIQQKKDRKFGSWIALVVCVLLLVACGWFGYRWYVEGEQPPLIPVPASAMADPTIDESPVSGVEIDDHKVAPTQPRYISIPAIGVEKTRVIGVGLTKDKQLDTPKNINDTAWYTASGLPGSGYGAVVIDGHNGGVTKDGIFAKLSQLKVDDEIMIERGDGKKITYKVAENETMSLKEANESGMKNMMLPIDPTKEGLSLITCAGNWVPRDKVFDKRVMLRAVAVN